MLAAAVVVVVGGGGAEQAAGAGERDGARLLPARELGRAVRCGLWEGCGLLHAPRKLLGATERSVRERCAPWRSKYVYFFF